VRCATKMNFMIFLRFAVFPRFCLEIAPFPRKGRRSSLRVLCATKSICLGWFQVIVPLGAMCNENKLSSFVALRNFSQVFPRGLA
jgi:hypothetical protein